MKNFTEKVGAKYAKSNTILGNTFDAPKIFSNYFEEKVKKDREKVEKEAAMMKLSQEKFNTQKTKASTTASGLKYFISEKGEGPKVTTTNKVSAHY